MRSVEAKAGKAASTAVVLQATVQAKSGKRKGVGIPKAPRKKVKSGRGSKVATSEEVAESGHGESGDAHQNTKGNLSEVSVVRPDVDLMVGAIPMVPSSSQPPPAVVQLMPYVLSDDSSKSSAAKEAAAPSTSASEEMPTEVDGRSAKTPQPEEPEAESEDCSLEHSRGKMVVEPPQPSA